MTLAGERQRLADKKESTVRNFEIVGRLKEIKEELISIKKELDRAPTGKELPPDFFSL
jgi:hypothetical protein